SLRRVSLPWIAPNVPRTRSQPHSRRHLTAAVGAASVGTTDQTEIRTTCVRSGGTTGFAASSPRRPTEKKSASPQRPDSVCTLGTWLIPAHWKKLAIGRINYPTLRKARLQAASLLSNVPV